MSENEAFEKIFCLCESDPDAGLEFIKKAISENPVLESYVFLGFCKARAYQVKGVQPLRNRPWVNVGVAKPEELRSYINDENLNYLELALSEIKQMEEIDPSAPEELGERWEEQIDAMACILERCRPGRVQQILGKTKLNYFGVDRIHTVPHITDEEKLSPEELRPFLQTSFSFPSIIKSALVYYTGKDVKGRKYILCWLFGKVFNDFGDNETFGDAKVGEIYLFDDGTFTDALEEEHKGECISEGFSTLFQLGKMLIDAVTDEAMEVRDESRLLTGAFLYNSLLPFISVKEKEISIEESYEWTHKIFELGYIAKKEHGFVKQYETYRDEEIGASGEDWEDEQLLMCAKLALGLVDVRRKETDRFLSKYNKITLIINALSKEVYKVLIDWAKTDVPASVVQNKVAGKLAASFVLGYAAAKYPKRFQELLKDKM